MENKISNTNENNLLSNDVSSFLFKFDGVSKLLSQIDDRIDIMEMCSDVFTRVEGINLISLWRDLYSEISEIWLSDMNKPFITLNKLQENKLIVVADIVKKFFLHNGNEVHDNEFLENVEEFFKQVNPNNKTMSESERWDSILERWEFIKKAIV